MLITPFIKADSLVATNQVDLFFPLKNEFDWASIEKQNDKLKAEFIKNHPNEFFFYQVNEVFDEPLYPDLENYLHIVDFNGDGLDDVIFYGKGSWEPELKTGDPNKIKIFINTGDSFVNIFTGYHEIYKIVVENGRVNKLYIKAVWCCCEYIERNKIYHVDYSSKLPKVNRINEMQVVHWGEFPSKYFDNPINFEVLNNKYNIRFSPVIDDTTEVNFCGDERNGNSLGKIKSGSIGYALAEKIDSTGRVWWFVAIDPKSEIYESLYYSDKICPDSYKLGWISSRFVKEI